MTIQQAAEAAWREYRDVTMKGWPRRQIRKREFIAAWDAAIEQAAQVAESEIVRSSYSARTDVAAAIRSLSTTTTKEESNG